MLVRVRAVALNPIDLYIRSGMVAMPHVVSLCHRLRPRGDGRGRSGRACTRFKSGDRVWGSNQGLLGRQGVAAEYAAVDEALALPDARLTARRRGRGHGPGRDHGAPRPLPVRPAQGGRDWSMCPAAAAGWARWSSRWPRRPAAGSPPPPAAPSSVELCRRLGADLALNYKTDDIPARLREFAPEGIDVWYETQREPNLEVSIPLLRKRGRMILIAGRAAKPVLPAGGVLPAELLAARLRHVQRLARRAAPLRRRYRPLDRGRRAQAASSAAPSRSPTPREAERFLEENTSRARAR